VAHYSPKIATGPPKTCVLPDNVWVGDPVAILGE